MMSKMTSLTCWWLQSREGSLNSLSSLGLLLRLLVLLLLLLLLLLLVLRMVFKLDMGRST
jgi:hypothetical protein